MIKKDDIERLKALERELEFTGNLPPVNGYLKSLRAAIAQLTQPYQWGDAVEISTDNGISWTGGYYFIGKSCTPNQNDAVCYVVERNRHGGSLAYAYIIRTIKQTVQVTLDKEIIAAAKDIVKRSGGGALRGTNDITPFDICKAIAQEGENK